VFEAHTGKASAVMRAQQELMRRYCGAIYRYLLASVHDPNVADDLAQEFALRLVRGDFKNADPGHGRFRDFLKTALYHLIIDFQRRKSRRRHQALEPEAPDLTQTPAELPSDQEFLARWREELLNRAWEALEAVEKETRQPFYTVLRYRAENPEVRSAQMAHKLQGRLGKLMTDVAIRQILHRSREKFADLLLEEVAQSLADPRIDRLEQELIDLDLLSYCRTSLERFARRS
jgi:RNA polymerase sigma-70 factor (ECF subfamily)